MRKVLGGAVGMIFKFILIIAFAVGGCYCLFSMSMFPFIWEGLKRLAIAVVCVLGIVGLLRIGREKDDDAVTEDDFRP